MEMYKSVSDAIRAAVDAYRESTGENYREIANNIHIDSDQVLRNKLNPNNAANKFNIDQLINLMLLTDDRAPLREIERILDEREMEEDIDISELLVDVPVHTGRTVSVISERYFDDGEINLREQREINPALQDTIKRWARLGRAINAKVRRVA